VAKLVPIDMETDEIYNFSSVTRVSLLATRFRPPSRQKTRASSVILVDTHIVVWLAFDQNELSTKARLAIDDARKSGDGLAISDRVGDTHQ
jgi:hypothetical protein